MKIHRNTIIQNHTPEKVKGCRFRNSAVFAAGILTAALALEPVCSSAAYADMAAETTELAAETADAAADTGKSETKETKTENTAEEVKDTAAEAESTAEDTENTAAETENAAADPGNTAAETESSAETENAAVNTENTAGAENAAEKNETVYVIADRTGTPEKIIVSDWLVNRSAADSLQDLTNLSEIENLKGEEGYSEGTDGGIVWDAQGNDIWYQGIAPEDAELPVTVSVSYLLNGTEITAAEAEGASGEITVRYSFENHTEKQTDINGETVVLHVPFAAAVGFLADESMLTDVKITNGRMVSDGSRSLGIGIAFPGLAEDLSDPHFASLSRFADTDIPSYVEITAHTENFRPFTAYAVISNELLTGDTESLTGKADELFGLFGTLKSSVGKIADGVSSLNQDAGTISDDAAALEKTLSGISSSGKSLQQDAQTVFDAMLDAELGRLKDAGLTVPDENSLNAETCADSLRAFAETLKRDDAALVLESAERLESCSALISGITALSDDTASAKADAKALSQSASSMKGSAVLLNLETGILNGVLPDLNGLSDALKAVLQAGAEYTDFSGLADGMSGKVRFIWKIS